MAAERAPTIATTIHSQLAPNPRRVEAALAQRQQRSGQREGQGEDRVLELDHVEREPKAFPDHAGIVPSILPLMAAIK